MPTTGPGAGNSYWLEVWTSNPTTGAAQDLDASANPTVTVRRNGADDSASWAWTWTHVGTGHYQGASTVPAGYAAGDTVWISAAGTVAGAAGGNVADHFLVGSTIPTAAQVATAVWQDATAGDFAVSGSIGKSLYTSGAAPGAAGGLFVAGTNAPTAINGLTLSGANASGGTPATAGLACTGGAGSTSLGGLSAPGIAITGGASAAGTNIASLGIACAAGASNFSGGGNDGAKFSGTGNGNGVTFAHAGSGLDLNAQTTNALQVNVAAVNAVSASSVTAINANLGTTQPVNFSGTGASALVKDQVGGYAAGQDPATLVLGATASSWDTAGTIGADINAAGLAGDPWATALPGSYASGTAGNILGNRLDVAVSTRLAASSYSAPPSAATVSAAVWNEINTASTHNLTNSTGKQLRSITVGTSDVIRSGTLPSQAGMTPTQVKLDAGASSTGNQYQWDVLSITGGTDAGDSRLIVAYDGSTKICTLDAAVSVQPDATSTFEITPTARAQVVSYFAGQDPATLVLDVAAASHDTAGTIGHAINAIGSPMQAGNVTVGGYAPGEDPATLVLDATASAHNTAGTIGHAINAIGSPMQAGASVTVATNNDKAGYSLDLTQALSAARALDAIADTSLTLNDALHCAIAGAAGGADASGGGEVITTPSTGTVLRTFTLTAVAGTPSSYVTKRA